MRTPVGCSGADLTRSGTDAPGTNAPGTDAPGTDALGTDAPGTDAPGTGAPGDASADRDGDDAQQRAWAARARSFGAVAGDYDTARPGYPAAAVGWAVAAAGRLQVAVDLGAGTGKLTASLRARARRVVAVDPSAGMLAALRTAVPGVAAVRAAAEALPLASGVVDAVLAGQAFHWFDLPRAVPELGRVLRPGGALGVLWNVRDESVAWVAAFGDLVGAAEDGTRSATSPALTDLGPLFGAVQHAQFRHQQRLTVDAVVALAASRSAVAVRPPAARRRVLDAVRDLAAAHAAADQTLALPYHLDVFRAQRR